MPPGSQRPCADRLQNDGSGHGATEHLGVPLICTSSPRMQCTRIGVYESTLSMTKCNVWQSSAGWGATLRREVCKDGRAASVQPWADPKTGQSVVAQRAKRYGVATICCPHA